MGKPSNPRRLGDNEAQAFSKTIRVSPQKLNLVAQSIRGLPAERALAVAHHGARGGEGERDARARQSDV